MIIESHLTWRFRKTSLSVNVQGLVNIFLNALGYLNSYQQNIKHYYTRLISWSRFHHNLPAKIFLGVG